MRCCPCHPLRPIGYTYITLHSLVIYTVPANGRAIQEYIKYEFVFSLKFNHLFHTLTLRYIETNIPKALIISQRTPPTNNGKPLTPENRRANSTANPNAIQITRSLLYKVM